MVYNIMSYEPSTYTVTLSDTEVNLLIDGLISHLLWATDRQNSDHFSGQMAILQEQKERDFTLIDRLFSIRSHEPSMDTVTVTLSDLDVHRLHSGLAILGMAQDTQKNSSNLTREERVLLKRRERSALKLSKRLSKL
jgi:hypothetical protein